MTTQEQLHHDLVRLSDWLGAGHGVELPAPSVPFSAADPDWLRALDAALSAVRHLNATAPRDRYELILQPLPDAINAAYANLFRHRHKPFAAVANDLRPAELLLMPALATGARGDGRRTPAGGAQRSAFPDGAGGVSVDDYGFPGNWEYSIDDPRAVTRTRALRTIDALSKAGARGGRVRFVASDRADPSWDTHDHEVRVPESFASLGRRSQVERLLALDAWCWGGTAPASASLALPAPASSDRPDALLATLALVHTGKARDYTHYRFNYRIAVLAQRLAEDGFSAASRTIEDRPGYTAFLAAYRARPCDVVVISVYQHKPDDMRMLAGLLQDLRAIRTDVFVVLEGAATQPAKQMLALFPEIDMLVRGESETAVRALLTCKERGKPLSGAQLEEFLRDGGGQQHGLFVRTPNGGVFSGLDCEQQEHHPGLLHPERRRLAVWYSERGCPSTCGYCPLYTGHQSRGRVVSAGRRIQWMLDRLTLELAGAVDNDALRAHLRSQAAHPDVLIGSAPDPRFALRDDTFIGREKVTITIVSQNALVNRSVWLAFCREIADLGLQKYFRIKVADTSIMTLWRNGAADRELMRSLEHAGVFFIGFGTESLSERILGDLRKGRGHRDASDYDADAPIEIVAALQEEGFPAQGIRHNFMSNAPESRLEDVKEGMVLAYVGPLFNHSIELLGNGWGNARENRLYAMEGSLHTAIDSLRYGDSYHVPVPAEGTLSGGMSLLGEFFVCHEAPEYRIRREDGRLTYIDERLQPLATAFTYPTFYRYAMKDVLQAHVSDDEVDDMRFRWATRSSRELQALARVLDRYQHAGSALGSLNTIFRVKAHMLAAECVRFSEWERRLDLHPALPMALERAEISRLVTEADDCMRPASFDAGAALGLLMRAAKRARLAWLGCGQNRPEAGEFADAGEAAGAVRDLTAREAERSRRGLHTALSYPDSQQFDDLCRACPGIPADTLFDRLTQEMRRTGAPLAKAVRNIACRELTLAETEFDEFVKLLKAYDTIPLFDAGGPLALLHGSNPAARDRAREQLRHALTTTEHPVMRRVLEHSLAAAS